MPQFVQHTPISSPSPEVEMSLDIRWSNGQGARDRVADTLVETSRILGEIDQLLGTERKPRLIEDLPEDETATVKFASFLGETSIKLALEQDPEVGHGSEQTLAKSISEANKGDEEAMRRVEINVGSATTEGWFKKGHFTKTNKVLNSTGEIVQFGLTTENMHRDAIVHRPNRPRQLKDFTLAEARNGFREQELVRQGKLKDSWLIVPSCVPEDLPEEQLDHRGDGYFTLSMTYSLQGTTQEGSGIVTETIFDQGTDANEYADYDERQSKRFDIAAIGKVYNRLGLPAPKTALEMLQTPIEVPKHLMPNGMVDFWRWVDEAADELRDQTTVRTEQEYIARIEASRQREASLAKAKQTIKEELLALDGVFDEDNDIQAVDILWELVRKHGPKEASINNHIDPLVFGPDAADKIDQARHYMRMGDEVNAQLWVELAQDVATVSGCGGGSCGLESVDKKTAEGKNLAKKVKAEDGDEIVKDKERKCKCGAKQIVYAFNKNKVNKYCGGCGAFESKRTKK